MPENDEQDISARAQAPAETPLEKFEREQLTRRQALRKFGITSAMATFALFSVDDLARMVGKAMQQRAADNKVAEQVAQEFQHAGIALADGTSGSTCEHCCTQYQYDTTAAIAVYCYCASHNGQGCYAVYKQKMNDALYAYNGCETAHCPSGSSCIIETTPPAGCTLPS